MKTKKTKVYTIKTADGLYDGGAVLAYTHAAALRTARKHAGTQRGGIKTTVRLSHVCAQDVSDFNLPYLDARRP